jgi:hypothetical protein
MSQVTFLAQLGLLLLFGRVLGEVMQRLGQPAVMGQLLAGLILGPSFFGFLWPQAQHALFPRTPEQKGMLDSVSQLGVLMLLLLTGMNGFKTGSSYWAPGHHLVHRWCYHTLQLRFCPRSGVAGFGSSETRAAPHHIALSWYRAIHFVRENRGHGGARDEFHAPKPRTDHHRFRHY